MLKKSKKPLDRFSGTEVGVLVEEFTSQVKLVNEGVLGLNDKVKTITKDLSSLHNKVDRVEIKIGKIENDVDVIKTDIEIIKHELKNKIGRDEFAILERRVALLESRAR